MGVLVALSPWSSARAVDDAHVLVLGRISDDPKTHYEQLKPLLDYIVPRMAGVGIREGRILMARDAQQMASYLRRGRVDWVTETSGTGVALEARAGAKLLLMTERDGVSHYRTVFFARRDSGITSLDQLRGHSVAFQNISSTSAYFVPASELLERGMRLELLMSPMDKPTTGTVGYVFARSELNIANWVHKRLVDVGVMSNIDWDNPQRVPPSYRSELQLLRSTPEYPRAVEVVRGDLDPKVEARLREVLVEAAQDPDARDALRRFFKTTRFLPIDAASGHALEYLRQGVKRVRTEVE
ncbi:phosphate/phosphite/phosphonate ABC transporter substrate-binding protein [Luteimonas sp. SX5]|uniref:Phosphate/phosphite/phosphonate ABC transporter substrate-binding protein n=1 Tax=Luteimonas galliterrae TaxID=2940486 RepID=A0ABT0ME06_9GAMM|nr:phosphate/phosphite/phosphonate ABC transporter substrate-binding protein [Luteimonas galliterrae]MCL1633090.1 phosphate/phosphite/phosphonate ABC transporter substrate-binding protein [Luteimonas galliterrae]